MLDRLASGHSVASVAHDLDLSDQTIYNWRRQDRIDHRLQPGLNTGENGVQRSLNPLGSFHKPSVLRALSSPQADRPTRRPTAGRRSDLPTAFSSSSEARIVALPESTLGDLPSSAVRSRTCSFAGDRQRRVRSLGR